MSLNAQVYFDNNASTKICDSALAEFTELSQNVYANTESSHLLGQWARVHFKKYQEELQNKFQCSGRFIWTSGATESLNQLFSSLISESDRRLILPSIEHAGSLMTAFELYKKKCKVKLLPVDSQGQFSLEDLKAALAESPSLLSMSYGHNVTGGLPDITALKKIIGSQDVLIHGDASQCLRSGLKLNLEQFDFVTLSSHKSYGPKGIGALWVRDPRFNLRPLLFGGGQQENFRSGSVPLPLIGACVKAWGFCLENSKNHKAHLEALKLNLLEYFASSSEFEVITPERSMSHTLLVKCLKQVSQVDLSQKLRGFALSRGSACSDQQKMRMKDNQFENFINDCLVVKDPKFNLSVLNFESSQAQFRISFGFENTMTEVESFIEALKEL